MSQPGQGLLTATKEVWRGG